MHENQPPSPHIENNKSGQRKVSNIKGIYSGRGEESQKNLIVDSLTQQISGIIMKKPQIINQYEEDNLYEQIIPRALNSPQLISPYQYQRECDKLRENIHYMKLDYAQAQSDKIELMRDLATYQSQVCDHIDIATKMSTLKDLAKKTLE